MLPDREYEPGESDVLYHYCSAETFLSICQNKTIRFSDLFSMNDFMEMRWGYGVWEEAATLVLGKVGKPFLDRIDVVLHEHGKAALSLACCFSKHGDVLSQWRAYAEDGRGYAIGFRAKEMKKLPARALEVLYSRDRQVEEVKNVILTLHNVSEVEKKLEEGDFESLCIFMAYDLASLKNPAFIEEAEVRLIHGVTLQPSGESAQLIDMGGTAFGKPIEPQPVEFFVRDGVPVPYMDIDFSDGGMENLICEVVVGPKNQALVSGVSIFLETVGVSNVKVIRSKASYR